MKKNKITSKQLFDHLKCLIASQGTNYFNTLSTEDKKTFNVYMIQRFLSMNEEWIDLVSYVDKYTSVLSKKEYYALMISLIPKTQRTYYKYVKNEQKEKYPQYLINLVKQYYTVSYTESVEYITILLKRDIDKLINLCIIYGIPENQYKKFFQKKKRTE